MDGNEAEIADEVPKEHRKAAYISILGLCRVIHSPIFPFWLIAERSSDVIFPFGGGNGSRGHVLIRTIFSFWLFAFSV